MNSAPSYVKNIDCNEHDEERQRACREFSPMVSGVAADGKAARGSAGKILLNNTDAGSACSVAFNGFAAPEPDSSVRGQKSLLFRLPISIGRRNVFLLSADSLRCFSGSFMRENCTGYSRSTSSISDGTSSGSVSDFRPE